MNTFHHFATISHFSLLLDDAKLNTIMDYDLVLVMDAGRAVEFASPKELLENPDGIFAELVDATGTESSLFLREMANKAAAQRVT